MEEVTLAHHLAVVPVWPWSCWGGDDGCDAGEGAGFTARRHSGLDANDQGYLAYETGDYSNQRRQTFLFI